MNLKDFMRQHAENYSSAPLKVELALQCAAFLEDVAAMHPPVLLDEKTYFNGPHDGLLRASRLLSDLAHMVGEMKRQSSTAD